MSEARETGQTSKPVRAEDAFDVDAVAAWLGLGPIAEVTQFPGGASNLTYLVRLAEAGEHGTDLILRRPPTGQKAAGAHDMAREFRIQAALAPVFAPVPRMVGLCEDDALLGSTFYVMEKVPGSILRRDLPGEWTPEDADTLCARVLDVLVDLHSVEVSGVPDLAALARGEGYVARQVGGWSARLTKAATDDLGDWAPIVSWLEAHQPPDVAARMIHNDYRLDNLVLSPSRDVVGVLDWEMATVGDPLMDLAGSMSYWVEAGDDEFFQMFRRQPSSAPGMWTREQWVQRYCARMGFGLDAREWLFYEVFGLFRLAVIAQQIWYRYYHRQTTNEAYAVFGPAVGYLESRCRSLLGFTDAGA